MTLPEVSVVTAVYNGGRYLAASLESILGQEGVDFECVVVNDGSIDDSGRVLEELARRDSRLRVLHQANSGLTRALIRGCVEARGRYIARHDSDDLSLPGRLARQQRMLDGDPSLSMASCWAMVVGPDDEFLFEIRRPTDPDRATQVLLANDEGPVHGSVMFRADLYREAGGYRTPFRVAQDWDLWLRLVERGGIGYVPEPLYAHRIQEHSISARRRDEQRRLVAVARRSYEARRRGEPEQPFLSEAESVSSDTRPSNGLREADNSYFIGKCLLERRDRRALPYLARSVQNHPWRWQHWAALALASVCCRRVADPPGATARRQSIPANGNDSASASRPGREIRQPPESPCRP